MLRFSTTKIGICAGALKQHGIRLKKWRYFTMNKTKNPLYEIGGDRLNGVHSRINKPFGLSKIVSICGRLPCLASIRRRSECSSLLTCRYLQTKTEFMIIWYLKKNTLILFALYNGLLSRLVFRVFDYAYTFKSSKYSQSSLD